MAALLHMSTYLVVWDDETTEAAVTGRSCAADVSAVSINKRSQPQLNTGVCSSMQCSHGTSLVLIVHIM